MAPNTTPADRAIYAACANLEKSLSAHNALRRCIPSRLPVAAAEIHMNDIETHLDAIRAKLTDALAAMTTAADAVDARLADRDFVRWTHTLSKPVAIPVASVPANDDASLMRLVAGLRGGVL